jgi:hypothetical protein
MIDASDLGFENRHNEGIFFCGGSSSGQSVNNKSMKAIKLI